jgi:hypothetical protein
MTLHLTYFVFNLTIPFRELRFLRAAVSEKAGLERDIFHNHVNLPWDEEPDKLHNRYPLIQYTLTDDKFTLLGIGLDARSELQAFASRFDGSFELKKKTYHVDEADFVEREFTLQVSPQRYTYQLQSWIAFNAKNFEKWQNTPLLKDRVAMLENLIVAHIIGFAKGVQWQIPDTIHVDILDMDAPELTDYRKVKFLTFTLRFQANVILPVGIGLGKSVSEGFGRVYPYNP